MIGIAVRGVSSVCNQAGRKENLPFWLWAKMSGKVSGKGMGQQLRNHLFSDTELFLPANASVGINDKGCTSSKSLSSFVLVIHAPAMLCLEERKWNIYENGFFPAAHDACQWEKGNKAGLISPEKLHWFWFCLLRALEQGGLSLFVNKLTPPHGSNLELYLSLLSSQI